MLSNRLARLLRLRSWFPHVPLALIVGLAGLAQLMLASGSLHRLIALSGGGRSVVINVAGHLDVLAIRGVPQEAIGALLLLAGVGLVFRSRLVWVLTFLLTLATVGLEFSPLSTASKALIAFNVLLLIVLLLARRSFTRASLATGTLFALTAVLVALGYGVLGSYVLGTGFRPRITNVTDAIYFAVVTMSTVGYGDFTPQSPSARLFTVSLIVFGLAVFATSLTAIVGPLIDTRLMRLLQPRRKRRMKRSQHIIVIGDGPLAHNCAKALTARGLHATVVRLQAPPEGLETPDDLVVGDGSDTELLRSIGIEQARAVLALSDEDAYNAFVVLAAKEGNPGIRTVAAVSSDANSSRVSRVHPDVVLSLPLIGSELLAMALTGEEIQADALVSQLLKLG
ncbi:MAG: NAD-binding protein [Steroidobacteraceae bacterium]